MEKIEYVEIWMARRAATVCPQLNTAALHGDQILEHFVRRQLYTRSSTNSLRYFCVIYDGSAFVILAPISKSNQSFTAATQSQRQTVLHTQAATGKQTKNGRLPPIGPLLH